MTPRQPIPTEPISEPLVDPRELATQTIKIQRRIEMVWESAFREFATEPEVAVTVASLEREANNARDMEIRHLTIRAGASVEVLDSVNFALLDADAQHDKNTRALAAHKTATLQGETNLRDARDGIEMKDRTKALVSADMDLHAAVATIRKLLPALVRSVARRVHAHGIAARRLTVSRVAAQLTQAEQIVNATRERARSITVEEVPLLQLLDRARVLSGEPLPLPVIQWPNGTDPFRAPTLKDELK